MTLKVSFANQIHRISKTPSSYKELTQLVVQLFQNQLPERWTLQYVDADGDKIMLADEHDFQNLLDGELSDSKKAVKIHIVAIDGINQSQIRPEESLSESQVKQEEEYQVIEKQEPVPVEEPKVEQQEVAEEPKVEEPVEEVRQVEEAPVVEEEPKVEVEQEIVQNVAEPEQKEEPRCPRRGFGGHNRFHLKKILKKLSKTDLSAEKREHLEAKLREFESALTAEDRERFIVKKEEVLKRMTEKRAKSDSEFKEKVTDIIYQYLPTIASLTKEYVQEDNNKPQPQPVVEPKPQVQSARKVTHAGVSCDGCRKYPLTGIRYKCYACPDFDFCEDCEATKEHPHAFIKIRDSENFNSHRRGPRHHPFAGRGFWGNPGWCGTQVNRPEQPKAEESNKNVEQPKVQVPDIKNILESLIGKPPAQPTENKEKNEKVEKEAEELAKDLKKDVGAMYSSLPQDFKSLINSFLGNVPEKIFAEDKKEEAKPEEKIEVSKVEEPKVEEIKKEEVVIAEEPVVVNEVKAEVNENGPVIQVVEEVSEINKEEPKPIKKEYSEEVRNKVDFMREIFPDINEEELLEFVAKTPNLSIQELVENYLA